MVALRWLAALLMVFNAGWMTFDGARALIVGDYVTPSSGPHAGQLGPWAWVLRRVGLEPRSTPVKLAFVVYGLCTIVLIVCYLRGVAWGPRAVLVAAAAGLWYAPIGTAANSLAIILLLILGARA